ncbi:MAG TPA: histidine phosphatase family protein [Acidimicrobiales bacterium]|jgi:probable phosphoglycerate mutase
MDGTRIVMLRHGESRAQELRVVGGHKGCTGLSERGLAQVSALRDRLAETHELGDDVVLYSSLMPRAVQTAEILAPALGGVEVSQECGLCEHHPGEGDGITWDEFEARYPHPSTGWDPDYRRVPGSETWNEMAARVGDAIDDLVARYPARTIVIACHGGTIVQAMIRFLALDPSIEQGKRAWFSPENASITEFRFATNPYRPGAEPAWEMVRFNDAAHLAGDRSGLVA